MKPIWNNDEMHDDVATLSCDVIDDFPLQVYIHTAVRLEEMKKGASWISSLPFSWTVVR